MRSVEFCDEWMHYFEKPETRSAVTVITSVQFLFHHFQVLLGLGGPLFVLLIIIVIVNILQDKKPHLLPVMLRSWEEFGIPEPLRSLEPYDRIVMRIRATCTCCGTKWKTVPEGEASPGAESVGQQRDRESRTENTGQQRDREENVGQQHTAREFKAENVVQQRAIEVRANNTGRQRAREFRADYVGQQRASEPRTENPGRRRASQSRAEDVGQQRARELRAESTGQRRASESSAEDGGQERVIE